MRPRGRAWLGRCLGLALAVLIVAGIATPRASAAGPERAKGRGALYAGEVGADLARIARGWSAAGAVSSLPPRLVTRGTSLNVPLPLPATDRASPSCATLLVLASPEVVFSMTFGHGDEDVRRDFPLESSVGLIEVARCGARKGALAKASIDALSPRAVLSFLLVVGDAPAPSSLTFVPERRAGALAPALELDPRPSLGPAEERLLAKRRARAREEPNGIADGVLAADSWGNAQQALMLAPGCHSFDVLEAGPSAGQEDIDARLIHETGPILVVDGSPAPDAHLALCLGEATAVALDVRGARPRGRLLWLHATWALPEGLPPEWGPRARGRLAETLQQGRFPKLPTRPLAASLGVQGTTRVEVSVRPGACYVVAVAALSRQPERLGLGARAGGRQRQVRARPGASSASLALCATGAELQAEVLSLGAGADWILAIWDIEQLDAP